MKVRSMLIGHVDLISRTRVAGWAADTEAPDRVVEVVVSVDGEEQGRVHAEDLRPDLRALRTLGAGHHGFSYSLPVPLSDSTDHTVAIRFAEGAQATVTHGIATVRASSGGAGGPLEIDHEPAFVSPVQKLPRYLIHVGPHKTGTKYLQESFRTLDTDLRSRRILYPRTWTNLDSPAHVELVSLLARRDPSLRDQFRELNRSDWTTIVLSAEDFVDLGTEALGYFGELVSPAAVEIVFYCRRWSELIFSGWQETIKHGSRRTFPEFAAGHLGNPSGSTLINYALVLDKFAAVFGSANVRLVSYSNLSASRANILRHFAETFLDWPHPPTSPGLANTSLGMFEAEMVRALNAIHWSRTGSESGQLYACYQRTAPLTDAAPIVREMERDIGVLKVNEGVPGLSTVHHDILAKYGDHLVPPKPGSRLFTPTLANVAFVRDTYALDPTCNAYLTKLYNELIVKNGLGDQAAAD